MESKIKEAIKRLGELPPSKWTPATVLQVKQWLFPRIIAYMDGYREDNTEKNADEVFDEELQKEGEPNST